MTTEHYRTQSNPTQLFAIEDDLWKLFMLFLSPFAGYSYKIDLYTGDIWGAGTDANVLLTIHGEDGDSGQRILDNSGNNFERDSYEKNVT